MTFNLLSICWWLQMLYVPLPLFCSESPTRLSAQGLTFLSKRKKKTNLPCYRNKRAHLWLSTITILPTHGNLFSQLVLASWYWDIASDNLWRTALFAILLPGPFHQPSHFPVLAESQPAGLRDAVSRQGNFLLLKTSPGAPSVQHLQLPWSTESGN